MLHLDALADEPPEFEQVTCSLSEVSKSSKPFLAHSSLSRMSIPPGGDCN